MATPLTTVNTPQPVKREPAGPDKRLNIDDILKLMVVDGLISRADGEKLSKVRTRQYEHPMELIAAQNWKSGKAPHPQMSLEWLTEWLAGKLGARYYHIDPLKIDLNAVTATMSNAYAERYRILPVELKNGVLLVATGEPFVRAWAPELERILKVRVDLALANPAGRPPLPGRVLHAGTVDEESDRKSEGRHLAGARLRAAGRTGRPWPPRRQRPARGPHRRLAVAIRVRAARLRHPRRAAP